MNKAASRVYRWLLYLYPAGFREEYERQLLQQFRDDLADAGSGMGARVWLWLSVIGDLLTTAVVEWTREFRQDAGYAFRMYRRGGKVTLFLAAGALALVIGACASVFSVLSALLLQSLPFRDAHQLVALWKPPQGVHAGREAFQQWIAGNQTYLQDAAAYCAVEVNVRVGRETARVHAVETTSNLFSVLGANPALGRVFAPSEDRTGANAVAVISTPLWLQAFGGAPDAIGQTVYINGVAMTVAGIAPARFDFPGNTDVWMPTAYDFRTVPKQGAFLCRYVARLRDGVTVSEAARQFAARVPAESLQGELPAKLTSMRDELAGPVGRASLALGVLLLLLFLAACANVAQLLLSRTASRQKELSIRSALGASRARLTQQLVTESTILTLAGAAAGLLLAYWGVQLLQAYVPAPLASLHYSASDPRVVIFVVVLAVLTGVVFGVLPGRAAGTRARQSLIVVQVGVTLVLLTGTASLGQAFLRMMDADLGFETKHALTFTVSTQGAPDLKSGERLRRYYRDVISRVEELPGVTAVGAVRYLPLMRELVMVQQLTLDSGTKTAGVLTNGATSGYFAAVGTKVLAGSTEAFQPGTVIVDAAFARSVGMTPAVLLQRGLFASWSKTPYRIVAVVDSIRMAGPAYEGGPQAYWPVEEEPAGTLTFTVRGDVVPAVLRDAVREVNPGVTVFGVRTMEERLADVVGQPRFYTTSVSLLGALAFVLAVAGMAGVAARAVEERRREIGIRMALGSTAQGVRLRMLGEAARPVCFGLGLGLAGAVASGVVVPRLIEGATQPGWMELVLLACVLGAIALTTCVVATGGVLRIDPAEAMRAE